MPSLDNKISNVFGTALPQWLKNQIATRSNYTDFGAIKGQEDFNTIYRANKTAWIRVVSSININGDENDALMNDMRYFRESLGINDIHLPMDLAKKYVLFGGIAQYLDLNKSVLRSGLAKDGAYGMLGDKEIQTSGYRPMPGIIDAKIDTQGRLGSIRMATINFKVWSKAELDIIDALYFKLGYTMLIEWGHTVFVKNVDNAIEKSEFGYSEFNALDPFQKNMTKETINLKIAQNVRATEGNYDGMLGIVTNFNFAYNQDSGYDCMIKVIGLGAIGDSLKINNSSNLPHIVDLQIKEYLNLIASEKVKKEELERNASLLEQYAAAQKKLESDKSLITGESYFDTVKIGSSIDGFTPIYNSTNNEILDPSQYNFTVIDVRTTQTTIDSYIFYWPASAGPRFAIPKVKNYLLSTKSASKGTTISLDLNYLNNINGIKNNSIKDYTDLLAYNSSFDINTLKPSKYSDLIKDPKGFGYTTGSLGTTVDVQTKSKVNWIRYKKNNVIYSTSVTIPEFVKVDGFNKPISLFEKIFFRGANINSNRYDQYNIRGKIINALINSTDPWIVDDQQKYNSNLFFSTNDTNDSSGIYVDTFNNRSNKDLKTLGLMLYKTIEFSAFFISDEQEVDAAGINYTLKEKTKEKQIVITIGLRTNDSALITSFTQTNETKTKESELLRLQNEFNKQVDENKKAQSQGVPIDQDASTKQVSSALTYQSNLELAIKSIELYALTKAVYDNHDLNIGSKVSSYSLSSEGKNREFIDGILQYGIYKDFLSDLFSKKINDDSSWNPGDNDYIKQLIGSDSDIKMRLFAKYGFNTAYMSAKSDGADYNKRLKDSIPAVDYDELTKVYVVPYDINQPIEGGGDIVHPVYIQLGFLLMILNSMCTIYESESADGKSGPNKPRPVVYIDYNPETNFCLTTPLQLTTDAFNFLIPMQASQAQFDTLFPPGSIDTDEKSGIKTIKSPVSGSPAYLFNPKNDDAISKTLPEFRAINGGSDAYRGKTMKILVSCEYILNIVKDFSANDGMYDVYLKPFLEQLIKDLNKSLGGINIFRVSYDDPSNCFAIVDDQIQPLAPGEKGVSQTATDQIPLFGVKSIAKSINIQTEIGSNLANMVAISANSNPSDQSANSTNASSFGFINNSFLDRYIPVVKELTPDQIKRKEAIDQQKQLASYDSALIAAQQFNGTIIDYYGKNAKPNKDSVGQATNYYINRMSKKMNQDGPTRASAMIPVSVNFTTDGISGFNIGQAFTIPPEILPYTYSTRQTPTIKSVQNATADAKVAFATVGINHVIQGNVWDTSIKGSMILIKDQSAFNTGEINKDYNKQKIDLIINTGSPGSVVIDPKLLNVSGDWINKAFQYISSKEGFEPLGKWDVNHFRGGYGSDKKLVDNQLQTVINGTPFTRKEAEDTLKYEIVADYSKRVIRDIGQETWNKISDNQKAALTSFAYNVGLIYPGIAQAVKSGNYSSAAQIIASGPYTADGKYVNGLEIRRKEESALFSKLA